MVWREGEHTNDRRNRKQCGAVKELCSENFSHTTVKGKKYFVHTCKDWAGEKKGASPQKYLFNDGVDKECGKCGKILPLDNFSPWRDGGPHPHCKPCVAEYARAYRKKKKLEKQEQKDEKQRQEQEAERAKVEAFNIEQAKPIE